MSSKIKVDTIENVAGSGNVSLGSGHNLVVPGDLTVDKCIETDSSTNDFTVTSTSKGDKIWNFCTCGLESGIRNRN